MTATTDERPVSIGDAAERLGISQRALRYYEQVGLLTPSARTTGGNRLYSAADLERVQRIRTIQELLGADLDAIRTILDGEDRAAQIREAYRASGDDDAARQRLLLEAHELYAGLLAQVDAKLQRLQEFRAPLAAKFVRVQELLGPAAPRD
jgi:DNA-binding transcriptional MerR regulator